MRTNNLFLISLLDNVEIEQNFILEEILHLTYVTKYLSFNPKQNAQITNTSLRSILNFNPILNEIIDEFEKLFNYKLELISICQKLSEENKHYSEQTNNNFNKLSSFFEKFVFVVKLKDTILEKLDFMQKKIVSTLENYPGYYPSAKESSIKDAAKIHFFIERLTFGFQKKTNKFFNVVEENPKDVYFYWDFMPNVNYINSKKNFIINMDPFIPYRQPFWIIVLHEIFHYEINNKENKNNCRQDFLLYIKNSIKEAIEEIEIACYASNIDASIDINLVTDIFIDSFLTLVLGIRYLLPIAIKLFIFDEENFYIPKLFHRKWYVRLRTAIEVYNYKHETTYDETNHELSDFGENIKKDMNEILEEYKNTQISNNIINNDIYIMEHIIITIINKRIIRVFDKKKKEINKFINELIKSNNNDEQYVSEFQKYLTLFMKYYSNFLKNSKLCDKKTIGHESRCEGRLLCRMYTDVLCFNKQESIKSLPDLPVYKFKFFRIRYDALQNNELNFEEMKEMHAIGFGSYAFLSIKENINEKYEFTENDKVYDNINLIRKISELNNKDNLAENSDKSFNSQDSIEKRLLIDYEIPFYEENLSITLYSNNIQKDKFELDQILKNKENYCYIFIKYQINRTNSFENFCNLDNFFKENIKKDINSYNINAINIFHFVSYDWFDFCTLIILTPNSTNTETNGNIELMKFLNGLKKNIIMKNDMKILRTETNIFIGKNIIHKTLVKVNRISFRVDSNQLGKTIEILEKIKKDFKDLTIIKKGKFNACFGAMDIVITIDDNLEIIFNVILNEIYKILGKGYFTDFQIIPEVQILD
jgi:hypothetical protein